MSVPSPTPADLTVPRYTELAPSPALTPWVECYWSIRGRAAPALPNRVLPDGCADLIVGIEGQAGPVAVGTMRTAALYPLAGPVDLFGIRFRPGGAAPFLGVPLGELTDRRVPLDLLWGPDSGALGDALEPAAFAVRAARAERVLRERLESRGPGRDGDLAARAVALLRRARGGVAVREVAAALGVGERRLERAFAHAVGIGPKALTRVLRLRRAVRAIGRGTAAGPRIGWAALAHDAGYADQPHLIREFRALAGMTPARYAAERGIVGFVQDGEDDSA
ncbi:MAG TPA: AraC family transcriptional regulator [Gemmatimonadales bacterium]|nr:AraC family transcriptional regulator [Gemmatimonadales bacterium]